MLLPSKCISTHDIFLVQLLYKCPFGLKHRSAERMGMSSMFSANVCISVACVAGKKTLIFMT